MKAKVVIFGAGKTGLSLYSEIVDKCDIIAFTDNNKGLWGKEINETKIINPEEIVSLQYDYIYIASNNGYYDIYVQLLFMEVEKNKIKIMTICSDIENMLDIYAGGCLNENVKYELEWLELRKKYRRILLFRLPVNAIGETILRIQDIVSDNDNIDIADMRVFIPDLGRMQRICNTEILGLARVKGCIVGRGEAGFWKWVLQNHFEEIDTQEYNKYLYRTKSFSYIMEKNNIPFTFSEEQIQNGKKRLLNLNINSEFVCMASRSSNYAQSTLKNTAVRESNIRAHEYRNSEFMSYLATIRFLQTKGLKTIRMGRGEVAVQEIDNCVDYAGLYADDFMDFFIMSECKFLISGACGISAIAAAFAKPILYANVATITVGYGSACYTDKDLYIPKKYYDINKKRCLTLKEIAELENHFFCNGVEYERKGISFIDNTEEEILYAAKEMLSRIEGEWIDTEEDIKIYREYEVIMNEINRATTRNKSNWVGGAIACRISIRYLKSNLYLLE